MSNEQNKQTVLAYADAFNRGEMDELRALFTMMLWFMAYWAGVEWIR
jgi:hypothetical protein